MTQVEFTSELEIRNIRYTNKLTKWGSGYWTIDGAHYRMSDHRKPIDTLDSYKFGVNDFLESDYTGILTVVLQNVEERNETRHLTYEQKETLSYGRYLQKNDVESFNNWINYNADFYELNK
jgi:hypothetical protein